jgi:hypothetical protein
MKASRLKIDPTQISRKFSSSVRVSKVKIPTPITTKVSSISQSRLVENKVSSSLSTI